MRRNIELTGLQKSVVAERQRGVRSALDRELVVKKDVLTGSYARKTLIGPLAKADVDVLIVLDRQYEDRGPRQVVELVRRVLRDTYPKTLAISRNGQAVTITFSDFVVDVVPAFRNHWWFGGPYPYRICDSGKDAWMETDPGKHSTISGDANGVHGGKLVPCIKQLKAWNRTVGSPLRSFHVEVLAWEIFGRNPGRSSTAGWDGIGSTSATFSIGRVSA
ncbi:MAG: nucleotidyltransferase protein [Chloroflexi bacterium]|nr:nucleotidyltransferase protein [Chloroflexota bacterium]